jgi:dienelactone hydrolase
MEVTMQSRWNLKKMFLKPRFRILDSSDNIHRVFYENEPYQGHSTEVFAYFGVPDTGSEKVPGMVCVHGGGGKAYREWVKIWMDRGYAAISMDLGGRGPDGERFALSGPEQDEDAKFNVDVGWHNLWTYHAIAAVIRGHSIMRNFPGVDATRIGVTGISWGGYLTCIAVGLDSRFGCAIPVYGCGFLQDNSADVWMDIFSKMGPDKKRFWHERCDPSVYLPHAKMPLLFVTGTNDFAYPMDSLKKSYSLPRGQVNLCVRIEMPHGHTDGWAPREIDVFTDSLFRGKPGLPRLTSVTRKGRKAEASFSGECLVVRGLLVYTTDTGRWQERKWKEIPLEIKNGKIIGELPAGTTVYFLAVEDERGVYVNTPHEEVR